MSDVNKQLLDALTGMVSMWEATCDAMNWDPDHLAEYDIARQAIAVAERTQQAEPVAWHTNDPCVSGEHIEAIAKVCKIIPSYTTVEYVDRIIGFGHVILADKSVQEAFVRANSHLLRADPAKPPVVPDGYALVPIEPTREMFKAVDKLDDEMFAGGCAHGANFEQLWEAAILAAPKP